MSNELTTSTKRISLRLRKSQLAIVKRAAALQGTSIADFVVRTVVREAKRVVGRSDQVVLSERDMNRVLELLEHPPTPNAKLIAAARSLPRMS